MGCKLKLDQSNGKSDASKTVRPDEGRTFQTAAVVYSHGLPWPKSTFSWQPSVFQLNVEGEISVGEAYSYAHVFMLFSFLSLSRPAFEPQTYKRVETQPSKPTYGPLHNLQHEERKQYLPTKQIQPLKQVQPVKQVRPSRQVQPAKPDQLVKPVQPAKQFQPMKWNQSAKQLQTVQQGYSQAGKQDQLPKQAQPPKQVLPVEQKQVPYKAVPPVQREPGGLMTKVRSSCSLNFVVFFFKYCIVLTAALKTLV